MSERAASNEVRKASLKLLKYYTYGLNDFSQTKCWYAELKENIKESDV